MRKRVERTKGGMDVPCQLILNSKRPYHSLCHLAPILSKGSKQPINDYIWLSYSLELGNLSHSIIPLAVVLTSKCSLHILVSGYFFRYLWHFIAYINYLAASWLSTPLMKYNWASALFELPDGWGGRPSVM